MAAEHEVLMQIVDVQRAIGRLEGKIDTYMAGQSAHMVSSETKHVDLEKRIRKVEKSQHWWSGVAAFLGLLFGIGGHKITSGG